MANKNIGDLAAFVAIDRTADLIEQYDTSLGNNHYMTVNQMLGFTGGSPVSTSDTQTLTNKTLGITNTVTLLDTLFTLQDNSDNTKQAQFQLSGITTGTTRTYTLPNASGTLVDLASSQTLTSKTLTSPTINTPTINNPTLNTNTVSEYTAANGVTVDGLNIKDGALNTANSVVTANYSDGSIAPEHLVTGAGTGWAWQSWTPTWTNLTVGNGIVVSKYVQIGKTVNFVLTVQFGTTSVMGSDPQFTLPVTASSNFNMVLLPIGVCVMEDAGTTTYLGCVAILSTTLADFRLWGSASTYVGQDVAPTSAIPMTWAVNDRIKVSGTYEAA